MRSGLEYVLDQEEVSTDLYSRYVESRGFLSSLTEMQALLDESLSADFSLEARPLATIAAVSYTCTRLWDRRPLARMAELARHYAHTAEDWYDEFRRDYALVAAEELGSEALRPYLRQSGPQGFRVATRSSSLAFFLRDEDLLYSCVRSMHERLSDEAQPDADLLWELEFGEAMYSALKFGKADIASLCRMASRLSDSSYLPYVSTDVNVLSLSISRGQPVEG